MLFTYTPVSHAIEKYQTYLDFLFFEVWICAEGVFNTAKLEGNKEFYEIFQRLELEDSDGANYFTKRIADIYNAFAAIEDGTFKEELKQAYTNNNNIEGLCCNKEIIPITYKDIKDKHEGLGKLLEDFYKKLYGSGSPFNLAAFGDLSKKMLFEYDNAFVKVNKEGICPFCGIHAVKGEHETYKEAYDHYMPKGIYPFNTINFKNLAPMCHECNSTYKLSKIPIYENNPDKIDPIKREGYRSLSFYPYAKEHPSLTFKINLKTDTIATIIPKEIDLEIYADECEEKITSWMRVFGLEERYKALLCKENHGKDWYSSISDEYLNAKELSDIEDAETYYKAMLKDAKRNLKSGHGFLKSVFLEECKEKGLFKNELLA